jgi:chemotaxis protein MotB
MSEELGFPPDRLAPTGFGEYSPIADNTTAEGRAQNRRIELKLTER